MEVVSPLTFANESNKRRFDDGDDVTMEESCGFQAAKRRRKENDVSHAGGGAIGGGWMSPFAMAAGGSGFGTKRSRSRSPPHSPALLNSKLLELQNTLAAQSAQLSHLQSEHASLLASHTDLSAQNAQLLNENKILKRAVTIQQERSSQWIAEAEEAKRVNEDAKEKMRRLEQMNLTLRYQLQAQNLGGNDFMGFPPRPPDVY